MTDLQIPTWTLGDRMRKARQSAGLDQEQLCAELGITRNTLSAYEQDVRAPRRAILLAVALRCSVPLEWLEGSVRSR